MEQVFVVNPSGGGGSGPAEMNLVEVGGSPIALGQTTMASSMPVTIASNQSALSVTGNKTNNNAAPGATNVGALVGLATAAVQTWTEGNLVVLSTDLGGRLRTNISNVNTPGFILSLINTSTQIKGSAGVLTSYSVSNTTSSARWLKFYDKASAVNPAADTPVWVEQLPAGPNTGHPQLPPGGINFTLGIQVRACTGQANADDGAPAANDITLSYTFN